MNQLILSNKSNPLAADWNVMFSASCTHWLGFQRENLILLGNSCGFPQNLCANYIEMGLLCKSPEIPFNPIYHAIKIDYPFFRSVRHVSVLSALVQNVDIRKTKVIFAVFGVQTTVLMEVRIFWNASPSPIGYRLFGVIRIFSEMSQIFTNRHYCNISEDLNLHTNILFDLLSAP
jgi:hypothetical protein